MARAKSNRNNQRRAGLVDVYIGQRIRAQRNIRDMSQEVLGKLIGVSFQQVQKYEKGVNRIGPARLIDVAHHLECTVDDLVAEAPSNGRAATPKSERAVAMSDLMSVARSNVGMRLLRAYLKLDAKKHQIAVAELAENLS